MSYQLVRKSRKPVTIIKRIQKIDTLTGDVTVEETTWSGDAGFVVNSQLPQTDLVPVADAWILTEQPLEDRMIVCCDGKSYSILKLAVQDEYSVASLKSVISERYVEFRADIVFTDEWTYE